MYSRLINAPERLWYLVSYPILMTRLPIATKCYDEERACAQLLPIEDSRIYSLVYGMVLRSSDIYITRNSHLSEFEKQDKWCIH